MKKLSTDQLISLLAIYEAEFECRENAFFSRLFGLFYASLIIMVCPFISIGEIKIDLPNVSSCFFIILGMLCETISFVISIIHGDRLRKSSATYKKILKMLPKKYRRISTYNYRNRKYIIGRIEKFMNVSLTYILPILFYILSISIGVILLITQTT